jgi:hypothetical protein
MSVGRHRRRRRGFWKSLRRIVGGRSSTRAFVEGTASLKSNSLSDSQPIYVDLPNNAISVPLATPEDSPIREKSAEFVDGMLHIAPATQQKSSEALDHDGNSAVPVNVHSDNGTDQTDVPVGTPTVTDPQPESNDSEGAPDKSEEEPVFRGELTEVAGNAEEIEPEPVDLPVELETEIPTNPLEHEPLVGSGSTVEQLFGQRFPLHSGSEQSLFEIEASGSNFVTDGTKHQTFLASGDATPHVSAFRASVHAQPRLATPTGELRDDAMLHGISKVEPITETTRTRPIAATPIVRALPPKRSVDLPESYVRWNRVLIQHCLIEAPAANGPAHLIVTPGILAAALYEVDGEAIAADEAEAELLEAVRLVYRSAILDEKNSLSDLSACDVEGLPLSVAFLAVSVLAAFQMHTDASANARGYYVRLSEQLQCDMSGSSPQGFDLEAFDHLWISLNEWLQDRTERSLSLPPPDVIHRHIAYPLCHVLLRRVDIEKLPELFESLGLDPGSRAEREVLGRALEGWSQLSNTGRQALLGDRRAAVEEQVAAELEAWDGSVNDRFGGRTAAVQIFLQFARSRPVLQYLPRRTSAFPSIFEDGERALEAADDRYYEPILIKNDDGPHLLSGFRWTSGTLSLHRPPSKVIPLRPASEMSGLISNRGLPFGERSAVLCVEGLERDVQNFLAAITGGTVCSPIEHDDIPTGWRLFRDIIPTAVVQPPVGLESLSVDTSVSVQFQGGLRLSRSAVWLKGAPPTILVSGPSGFEVSVDGQVAGVVDGQVEHPHLDAVGIHSVEIGRVKRRFQIADAEYVPGDGKELIDQQEASAKYPVALPLGSWTIIGKSPEDVYYPGTIQTGAVVHVPFAPQWALAIGAPKRATVALSLVKDPSRPLVKCAMPISGQSWARVIRNTQIRRPKLGFLTTPGSEVELTAAWHSYWETARTLRRRWKRHQ